MRQNLTTELDWLFSTQMFGIKLGLDSTRALIDAARVMPDTEVTVVHVAGTNGKGSTCSIIESLARAGGYRTGLFTSPHLVSFSERIRVNGEQISDKDLLRLLKDIRQLAEASDHPPTFFELTLVLALKYFKEQKVDFLILETGLGGRLDATNAIPKNIAVLTPIAGDHEQYLGNSLEDIAKEKADIISERHPVVTAPQETEVSGVIKQIAEERKSPLVVASNKSVFSGLSLKGEHQQMNAAVAVEVMKALHVLLPPDKVAAGLEEVRWPGRFELVPSANIILDGAHNPHAMEALVKVWKESFGGKKTSVVFAASADKNIRDMIAILDSIVDEWRLVPCTSPRILPAEEMKLVIAGVSKKKVIVESSLPSAFHHVRELPVPALVIGSLFLIGDAKALLSDSKTRPTKQ